MSNIRPEVEKFSVAMEEVLRSNDHKKGWKKCSIASLRSRITEELAEFDDEIEKLNIKKARKEIVDVANFCMMVHENLFDKIPAYKDGYIAFNAGVNVLVYDYGRNIIGEWGSITDSIDGENGALREIAMKKRKEGSPHTIWVHKNQLRPAQ